MTLLVVIVNIFADGLNYLFDDSDNDDRIPYFIIILITITIPIVIAIIIIFPIIVIIIIKGLVCTEFHCFTIENMEYHASQHQTYQT